jgi:hypothetical protein
MRLLSKKKLFADVLEAGRNGDWEKVAKELGTNDIYTKKQLEDRNANAMTPQHVTQTMIDMGVRTIGKTKEQLEQLLGIRGGISGSGSPVSGDYSGLNLTTLEDQQYNTAYQDVIDNQVHPHVKKLIVEAAHKYGVNPNFALAIAETESGYNQNLVSKKGAIGVMQIMPKTAESLGINPKNLEQNIDGGVRYLKTLLDEYHGNYQLAAAAYNAGSNNVNKYHGIPPFQQTEEYVKKVDALMLAMNNNAGNGSNVINNYYNFSQTKPSGKAGKDKKEENTETKIVANRPNKKELPTRDEPASKA